MSEPKNEPCDYVMANWRISVCVMKGGISAGTREKNDILSSGAADTLRSDYITAVCLDLTALLSSSKCVTFHFQHETNKG